MCPPDGAFLLFICSHLLPSVIIYKGVCGKKWTLQDTLLSSCSKYAKVLRHVCAILVTCLMHQNKKVPNVFYFFQLISLLFTFDEKHNKGTYIRIVQACFLYVVRENFLCEHFKWLFIAIPQNIDVFVDYEQWLNVFFSFSFYWIVKGHLCVISKCLYENEKNHAPTTL